MSDNNCIYCGDEIQHGRNSCTVCDYQRNVRQIVITTENEKENVNHPEHYQGKHECIDIMKALFGAEAVKGFCKCNAFKYRFRANKKNGEEDIKKAEWYEEYLMEMENEND